MRYFKEITQEEFDDEKYNDDFMQADYQLHNLFRFGGEAPAPHKIIDCSLLFARTNEEMTDESENSRGIPLKPRGFVAP